VNRTTAETRGFGERAPFTFLRRTALGPCHQCQRAAGGSFCDISFHAGRSIGAVGGLLNSSLHLFVFAPQLAFP